MQFFNNLLFTKGKDNKGIPYLDEYFLFHHHENITLLKNRRT